MHYRSIIHILHIMSQLDFEMGLSNILNTWTDSPLGCYNQHDRSLRSTYLFSYVSLMIHIRSILIRIWCSWLRSIKSDGGESVFVNRTDHHRDVSVWNVFIIITFCVKRSYHHLFLYQWSSRHCLLGIDRTSMEITVARIQ